MTWYHLYNLKTSKNTHWRVLLLVNCRLGVCNFAKSYTPPWVFFTFLNDAERLISTQKNQCHRLNLVPVASFGLEPTALGSFEIHLFYPQWCYQQIPLFSGCLKTSENSNRTRVMELNFGKVTGLQAATLLKVNLTTCIFVRIFQVFTVTSFTNTTRQLLRYQCNFRSKNKSKIFSLIFWQYVKILWRLS